MFRSPVTKRIWLLLVTVVLLVYVTKDTQVASGQPNAANTIRERGVIRGTEGTSILSPTTAKIVSVVAEGTKVNQGDLLVGLDDSRLNSQIERQQTVTKQALDSWTLAQADYRDALAEQKLQLSISDRAVRLAEFASEQMLGTEGTHPQEISATEAEKRIAETEAELTRQRLQSVKDTSSEQERHEAQIQLMKAEARISHAKLKLEQLRGVTLSFRKTQLELGVLRARVDELSARRESEKKCRAAEKNLTSRRNLMESMKNKLQVLEEQIANCQVFAPHDGVVRYTAQPVAVRAGRAIINKLAPGVAVRQDQAIIELVKVDRLSVETRTRAAKADRIQPGQKVQIQVDALPNETVRGVVSDVTATINPGAFVDEGRAEYTVTIAIDVPHPALRLGLTAMVEIDTNPKEAKK